jgi:hypothetical protein
MRSGRVLDAQIQHSETVMSSIDKTDVYQSSTKESGRKRGDNGVILLLLCLALALAVAGAIFTPVTVGSGINNENLLVGP